MIDLSFQHIKRKGKLWMFIYPKDVKAQLVNEKTGRTKQIEEN